MLNMVRYWNKIFKNQNGKTTEEEENVGKQRQNSHRRSLCGSVVVVKTAANAKTYLLCTAEQVFDRSYVRITE